MDRGSAGKNVHLTLLLKAACTKHVNTILKVVIESMFI